MELEALRIANAANLRAAMNRTGKIYWAVVVLYHWVVWERDQDGVSALHEIVGAAQPKVAGG